MNSIDTLQVGLFHQPSSDAQVVVGRQVAVDDFVQAALRFPQGFRMNLFCHGHEMGAARRQLAQGLNSESSRGSLQDRRKLSQIDALGLTAWHETQFDTYAPFALRARAARPFPVTVLHHTLSYKELRHDSILRLLLAKPHAYDALLCTSTAARTALKKLVESVAARFAEDHGTKLEYRGRYEVLPLAVDVDRFRPQDKKAARIRLQIEEHAFVLLWIGRLSCVDKADLLPLVRALATLVAQNPQRTIRLICAGSERPGEQFGAQLLDYAKHLGVTAQVRVITGEAAFTHGKETLYNAADVFVSPVDNIQESFGLTPLEAMACGIPQVVSHWDGYRDTVVDGVTGFLVPTLWADCQGDIEAYGPLTESPWDHLALAQSVVVDMQVLIASVQKLIDSPELARQMSIASRERATTQYAWPILLRKHENLWRELAEEARRSPEKQRDTAAYALPDYGASFGHFASHTLTGVEAVRLSALGQDLVAGKTALPTHTLEHWNHLESQMLQRLLGGLVHAQGKGTSLTLQRMVEVISKGDASARPTVLRHVLFLMKYGFVETQIG